MTALPTSASANTAGANRDRSTGSAVEPVLVNVTDSMNDLDHLMELGRDSLERKREVVQHYIDEGLFHYTRRYPGPLDSHFSTIGV